MSDRVDSRRSGGEPASGRKSSARSARPAPRRNAEATKANIIRAARLQFIASSYEAVSLRRIAAAADVDIALVLRYFGSKDGLFAASIDELLNPDALMSGPRETFGARLADRTLGEHGRQESFPPILLMLRAAGAREAQGVIQKFMGEHFTGPLAEWIGGSDAEARAHLVAALVAGTVVQLTIAPPEIFEGTPGDAYRDRLAAALQAILDE